MLDFIRGRLEKILHGATNMGYYGTEKPAAPVTEPGFAKR